MSQVNRNMKEKKGIVQSSVVKTVPRDGRVAKAIADKAAPGVGINRANLKKEPRSKNVIDATKMSKSEISRMDAESRITQYVNGGVNRRRKFDRSDSY